MVEIKSDSDSQNSMQGEGILADKLFSVRIIKSELSRSAWGADD